MKRFFAIWICLCLSVIAGDFEEGQKAYEAKEYQKAVKLFQKACDKGNARGCVGLGVMYLGGNGVKKDELKAVELFQKACESGEARGCFGFGKMYENGKGVKKDLKKAMEYFGKACEMRDELGCQNYSKLYDEIKR